jgi:hypothetical protein
MEITLEILERQVMDLFTINIEGLLISTTPDLEVSLSSRVDVFSVRVTSEHLTQTHESRLIEVVKDTILLFGLEVTHYSVLTEPGHILLTINSVQPCKQ